MAASRGSICVRVTRQTHDCLVTLATQKGLSMQAVLDQAVEAYRRQCFLEALNADFAALRKRKPEWEEEQAERAMWERTLADGLQDE